MNWFKQNWVAIVAGIMLLLAIPSMWPYGYYQLLRWIVAGSAGYIAFKKYESDSKYWMWTMIAVLILFNPLIPFHLDKEVWVVLDIISAVIFFLSTITRKQNISVTQ